MINITKPKGQRLFIRAKSNKTGKFEYIGYLPKGTTEYNFICSTSWLLRFGGYGIVRYYSPRTKKMVYEFNLQVHNAYCKARRYSDFVLKDGKYFVSRI